jgi:hypothetical protein
VDATNYFADYVMRGGEMGDCIVGFKRLFIASYLSFKSMLKIKFMPYLVPNLIEAHMNSSLIWLFAVVRDRHSPRILE